MLRVAADPFENTSFGAKFCASTLVWPESHPMTFVELEQLDAEDLPAALAMYKSNSAQFRLHVLNTLHPNPAFQWNLRTFPPFRDAFPEHAKQFDEKLKTRTDDPQCNWVVETGGDSVLTRCESLRLAFPPTSHKEASAQRVLVHRILAEPKLQDVRLLLHARYGARFFKPYTPAIHLKLVALIEPLKALIDDVEHKDRKAQTVPVRALGMAVNAIGGLSAQQAVFFAVQELLCDYRSYRRNGALWSDAAAALNQAWNNCGRWQS